jgi:hypothetical protein
MKQSDLNGDGVDEWMRKARFAHKAQTGDCLITLDDEQNVQIERIVKVAYLLNIESIANPASLIVFSLFFAEFASTLLNIHQNSFNSDRSPILKRHLQSDDN